MYGERKGQAVHMHRMIAGALVLMMAVVTAAGASGDTGTCSLYRCAGEGNRPWWGVLYGDALLLAQAEEEDIPPEEETEVVFVWPLWEWLLRFLGFR